MPLFVFHFKPLLKQVREARRDVERLLRLSMKLNNALRKAIRRAPCSTRALAREAKVSHVMLALIVNGKENATPRVALKVAQALEQWSARCAGEAAAVRAAVEGSKSRRRKR